MLVMQKEKENRSHHIYLAKGLNRNDTEGLLKEQCQSHKTENVMEAKCSQANLSLRITVPSVNKLRFI